ncbi:CHAT domain-containing protein [Leptolyngbya boryana CZ1]|uniref:CHAT domain-containing protein n=1 Tax=Leptolyngbya boryana CZ1 TaxID=3060204 RepID=A0AA96WRB4_LEPBY|nr:CHAT domain-containing protein [Leptolyngbya boryana]WNZ44098.1 CHAT domain-containing protein [Leptolyngbya boryana CZ1]
MFTSKEIPVGRAELSETITKFRTLLSDRRGDLQNLKQVSQKLYGWLIEPIRKQLDDNNIQNLIFSLDRSTRYIPMQALFDGKQYLIEKFNVSTILTAGLTDTHDLLSPQIQENPVLALGLSDRTANFDALPNVKAEIDAIVQTPKSKGIFPGLEFLNQEFTKATLQTHLIDHRILHIATHGKFVSGNPENSFLVLGNGEPLQIPDIQTLKDLAGIHLVVLSACQTAEGGQDKDGLEVSGISYYFLTTGAKSVIGSLWLVNDASTSLLMQEFYRNLSTGKMTKTQAMREVQRKFIQKQLAAKDASHRSLVPVPDRSAQQISSPEDYSHPYYWSPFILIGNGL